MASSPIARAEFTVNGRRYAPPARPVAVICIDGCADEYLSAAIARRGLPHLERMAAEGWRGFARGALPSFTNVNNAAIVAGAPPSVTGISGNFFLDPATGEEVMMNSPAYLRCGTILAAAARAGRRVAMVTAKEKLRDILSHGLDGIALSSERAAEARRETHGIDGADVAALVDMAAPDIYSADASVYVLRAGAALLERGLADFLYLSLTDYVQHRWAPWDDAALDFHVAVDVEIGRLLAAGAIVGATADHGMNAKHAADGAPRVLYLESTLAERFGAGARVICPITDPYVVHHGALGSLVMVHLDEALRRDAAVVARWIGELDGVTEVHDRERAARLLELPADRIGDLVVLAGRDVVLGKRPEDHDLSQLRGGLRSHGGRYEEMVPLVISDPLGDDALGEVAGDPRNFDVFDLVCNGTRG